MNEKIIIYTDGSCLGNPGPGGWGVVILMDEKQIHLQGGEKQTTNNRMEMTALIKALEWLEQNHEITGGKKIEIHSDSNLLVQTINRGWKKKANTDLWAKIEKLYAWKNIKLSWVKAHHTNHHNNTADELAFRQAKRTQSELKKR